MDNKNRDFKGIWIPNEIWLNYDLNANEKVLLAEIDSLDNENHCIASNDYFSNFLKVSIPTVTRAIKKLCDLGFITTENVDGRHRVIKMIRVPNQNDEADSSKRLTNNINNNINNKVLSKDNTISENASNNFDFGKPKTKKSNLYNNCLAMIYDYTNNLKLQKILQNYLDVRLEMKTEKPFYGVNQWKGILNKLSSLSPDINIQIQIVRQSIEKGWGSFFPISEYNKIDNKKFIENIEKNADEIEHISSGIVY